MTDTGVSQDSKTRLEVSLGQRLRSLVSFHISSRQENGELSQTRLLGSICNVKRTTKLKGKAVVSGRKCARISK